MGIAAGNKNIKSLSLQSIDKQFPTNNILDLVEQDILEVAINLIKYFKHIIQVSHGKSSKFLIIKIDISKWLVLQQLIGKDRFTTSPYTDDNFNLGDRKSVV